MGNSSKKFVYFLTGASGVGKTTLVDLLKEKYKNRNDIVILAFDSIGIPSVADQISQYGSGREWQRAATKKWTSKILHEVSERIVIFEGQVNFDFILEAFRDEHFSQYVVILIDCDETEMERRLKEERNQPELINDKMRNWRNYLRKQAQELDAPIINTAYKTKEEVVTEFDKLFTHVVN